MKVLLAVSGGIDSMYMAERAPELFPGASFAVAHCNFGLRAEESDGDEAFVRGWCSRKGMPIFVKHFDTSSFASEGGLSIEMAARELRYAWFGELCSSEGFDCVAIAHNADDNVETFFLNLLRGTGTRGLRGMGDRDFIVRPLLGISRAEIREWMDSRKLPWREDSTNSSTAYKRNRLRAEVIPVLKEMNPSLQESLRRTMDHIAQVDDIAEDYFLSVKDSVCSGGIVSLRALLGLKHPRYVLFRLVEPAALTETALNNLWDNISSGRQIGGRVFVGKRGEVRGLPKWKLSITIPDKNN
ncbi:MAG: tRNA lysidine(34) synthetase TilS [Bacteroidales bacterium]|nr:tRNA lysidine(34) synthetase TilS [Bacteroidales bacterium]